MAWVTRCKQGEAGPRSAPMPSSDLPWVSRPTRPRKSSPLSGPWAGAEVTPLIDALRPGDILLFSARAGAGVTHVGMYVGELKFIHSSNRGVKLSRLDPQDPEGAYWLDRWVGARRIIP